MFVNLERSELTPVGNDLTVTCFSIRNNVWEICHTICCIVHSFGHLFNIMRQSCIQQCRIKFNRVLSCVPTGITRQKGFSSSRNAPFDSQLPLTFSLLCRRITPLATRAKMKFSYLALSYSYGSVRLRYTCLLPKVTTALG